MNGLISDLHALTIQEESRRQMARLERARLVAEGQVALTSGVSRAARLARAFGRAVVALVCI